MSVTYSDPMLLQPQPGPFASGWTHSDCIDCWELRWNDEFDHCTNGQPDAKKWYHEHGYLRNGEAQWYQSNNTKCSRDGILTISAQQLSTRQMKNPMYEPEPSNDKCDVRATKLEHQPKWCAFSRNEYIRYTSSSIRTRRIFPFLFGQYDARIKIPTTLGVWPAWWLVGADTSMAWPASGEIDVLEYYSSHLHQPRALRAWLQASKSRTADKRGRNRGSRAAAWPA